MDPGSLCGCPGMKKDMAFGRDHVLLICQLPVER